VISGRIRIKMNDGNEEEYITGDVAYIPPGHNAWVVGNEPYTAIEFGTSAGPCEKIVGCRRNSK
jgi:quercetin dioxygenase-like cupin family protein